MNIQYVAVSKDGGFIAAGSYYGGVSVWDAKTYEQVVAGEIAGPIIRGSSLRTVTITHSHCLGLQHTKPDTLEPRNTLRKATEA